MPDNGHRDPDAVTPAPGGLTGGRADACPGADLSTFGFDGDDEPWLDRFRAADTPAPLGSIGPYEVLAELGRGGQGVVYKARQPGTGRIVAIKRLAAGVWASAASRRRFDHEIRSVSAMRHPHVVTVFAMDVVDDLPVFAMEWIEGLPITQWAAGHSATRALMGNNAADRDSAATRRPIPHLLECFLKVCDGVQHAHQQGLIHRDLKPANILVDAADEPHVLDFGLSQPLEGNVANNPARHVEPDFAAAEVRFAGTLPYAAPEQFGMGDRIVDTRSDVHALGVVLYQMLTGRSPWPASRGDYAAVMAFRCGDSNAEPTAPSAAAPDIPRELDLVVLKAIARDKADRYASVESLADDIRRFRAGDMVQAHPRTLTYAAGKLARRHRTGFALAAFALALLAGFSAWAWRAAIHARAARDLAMQAQLDALHARDDERLVRQQAEQVSAFLQETLSEALPARGGAGATLLDSIDRAARRLNENPPAEPMVEADIRYTIGRTYNALWKWREAEPHLARAVELVRRHGGAAPGNCSANARLADWLTEYGRSCTSLKLPLAVELQGEALSLRRQSGGEPSAAVAESLMRLAYAMHQASAPPSWDEAEDLFEEAIVMYRQVHADPHRDVASCLHNYGWMRYRQERYPEADTLYGEALAILNALGDARDPFRLELLHGYTSLKLLVGQSAESLALLEETIPLVRDAYGEPAVEPLYWRAALATQRLSRPAEARVWYARAIAATCREAMDASGRAAAAGQVSPPLLTSGAKSTPEPGLLRRLDDIRLAATLAEESADAPLPFDSLHEIRASLPPGLRARVERFRGHFDAFAAATDRLP